MKQASLLHWLESDTTYRYYWRPEMDTYSQAALKQLVLGPTLSTWPAWDALELLDISTCTQAEIKRLIIHYDDDRAFAALDLAQCSQDDFKALASRNPEMIQYVEEQSEELCYAALRRHSTMIQYVKNQTVELCEFALKMSTGALQFIREPTLEMYLTVVGSFYRNIEVVPPEVQAAHPEICELAVTGGACALDGITQQTPSLCMLAVRVHGGAALVHIRDHEAALAQFPDMYRVAVEKSRAISGMRCFDLGSTSYVDLCLMAARTHGELSSVMRLTPAVLEHYHEICLAAVQHTGTTLMLVEPEHAGTHYADICLAAVHQKSGALQYVKSEYVDHRYLELCWLAVRSEGYNLKHVNKYHLAFKDFNHYWALQAAACAPGHPHPWRPREPL